MAALAVSAEDVERVETGEGPARRLEAQKRVDADRLVRGAEVAHRAERVADGEDPLGREPQGDFLPEPAADDRDHFEGRAGDAGEGRFVERNADSACDRGAVAVVAVEELDDGLRLAAELCDALVDAVSIQDVRQPDGVADPYRV